MQKTSEALDRPKNQTKSWLLRRSTTTTSPAKPSTGSDRTWITKSSRSMLTRLLALLGWDLCLRMRNCGSTQAALWSLPSKWEIIRQWRAFQVFTRTKTPPVSWVTKSSRRAVSASTRRTSKSWPTQRSRRVKNSRRIKEVCQSFSYLTSTRILQRTFL